jgi:hypothetical protein
MVSHEAARRALELAGATMECPSCAGTDWRNFGLGDAVVILDAVGPNDKALGAGTGLRVGLFAHVLICANCGFVRLHSEDELAARLEEAT